MDITNIGRYQIKSELGRGGMATVYLAYDPSFDREVAIKALPREFLHNPQFLDRFNREIKVIAQLQHPAILPVYDVGEYEGLPYFVMRYMTGGSLADWITKGRIPLEDTARIVERLAPALSHAHRKGVIHRDLKPDNILFDENGEPFISDFGIAKFSDSQTNLTGSGIIGTPAYMSPEQATGDPLDHRSDIYGLGVIVYKMLTGQQPYRADTPMGVAIKHVTDPVPEIRSVAPDLPPELNAVMLTVLAKDREKRYASATEFARALNQVAFGHVGNIQDSIPFRFLEKPIEKKKPNRLPWIAGAIVVVLLLGIFLLRNTLFPAAATSQPELVTVTESLSTSAAANFAPMCKPPEQPALVSQIQETNRVCTDGLPYTTYSIPKGTTFEPVSKDFKCKLIGEKNGNDLIACTGTPLYNFDLNLCAPVDQPVLDTTSGKCSADAGYDAANQCCAPAPASEAGCMIFKATIGGC